MPASNFEILKKLTHKTSIGTISWKGKVEGSTGLVTNESHVVIPTVNTNDDPPNLFAWIQLKNKLLVLDTFSAKIISAGQEVQTLTQQNGSNSLTISQTGQSNSVVTAARFYAAGGHVELKWSACNTPAANGGGGGDGTETSNPTGKPCCGDPTRNNENAHRMIANYEFCKQDVDVGTLAQIYHYGKTPWLEQVVSDAYGVAIIIGPKFKGSVIKTTKMIVFKANNQIDFTLEPEDSTTEGKQLKSLLTEIMKQVSAEYAVTIGL